jgi:hypothetical protein
VPADFLLGPPVVIARIPADMRHVDRDALAIPNEILGQAGPKLRTVNISVNSPDWPEGPEPVQNLDRPEVSGVPYFVTFGEVPEDSIVKKTVCIRDQADPHFSWYPRVPPLLCGEAADQVMRLASG